MYHKRLATSTAAASPKLYAIVHSRDSPSIANSKLRKGSQLTAHVLPQIGMASPVAMQADRHIGQGYNTPDAHAHRSTTTTTTTTVPIACTICLAAYYRWRRGEVADSCDHPNLRVLLYDRDRGCWSTSSIVSSSTAVVFEYSVVHSDVHLATDVASHTEL